MDSQFERLNSVVFGLLEEAPFYGSIMLNLKWVVTDKMPYHTACTNGQSIFFHPSFIDAIKDKHLKMVCAHEVQHVIKKHMLRRNMREMVKWNMACDHNINLELMEYKVGEMPEGDYKGLADPKYKNWLEEDIYNDLPDPPKCYIDIGGFEDFPKDENGNPMSAEEISQIIDGMIERAAKIAKDAGKFSANLEDFLAKNRESKVDWRARLRHIVSPIFPKNVSWEKPNRRLISSGWYLPSVIKDGIGDICCVGDSSGSMSDEELSVVFTEINYILSECTPDRTQFILFDSVPYHNEVLLAGETLDSKYARFNVSRGGTDFAAAFEVIEGDPRCVIVVTDGECSYDNIKKPRCPVIWCLTTDVKPPWGEIIKVEV